jgi:hypothetical protein
VRGVLKSFCRCLIWCVHPTVFAAGHCLPGAIGHHCARSAAALAQLWAHAPKQRVEVRLTLVGGRVSKHHAPSGLKPAGSSSRWALMNPVSASNSLVGPSATICPWSITSARGHSSSA